MYLTWRRFSWSVRLNGWKPTVAKCLQRVHRLWDASTTDRLADSVALFDRRFNVATSGEVQTDELGLSGDAGAHAVEYSPSCPIEVAVVLEQLPMPLGEPVFLDFGCGKGLVTLLAAEFAFRSIVGIEASEQLSRIARDNVQRYQWRRSRSIDVSIWTGDARDYPLPNAPLVAYFYNPFDREVMERIVERFRASLEAQPRDCVMIYRNPVHRDVLDSAAGFRERPLPGALARRFAVFEWNAR